MSLVEVEDEIGYDVAHLIDGVTKLDKIRFRSAEQSRAENLRKMIVATAKDVRVLLIKIADRLHNMRTLAPLKPEKRVLDRARDPRDLRAAGSPSRHVRDQVGARGSRVRRRSIRSATKRSRLWCQQRQPERERVLDEVCDEIQKKLSEVKIKAEVSGRPKHLYSIYEKIVLRGKQFDEIFDLVGIRVVVDTVRDCYAALGAIHTLYTPGAGSLQGLHRDAQVQHVPVAAHDGDGCRATRWRYRSAPTTMHRAAEFGIAAHWLYKEQRRGKVPEDEIAWLQRMMDWQTESADPKEFMESLKIDLYAGRGLRLHAEG